MGVSYYRVRLEGLSPSCDLARSVYMCKWIYCVSGCSCVVLLSVGAGIHPAKARTIRGAMNHPWGFPPASMPTRPESARFRMMNAYFNACPCKASNLYGDSSCYLATVRPLSATQNTNFALMLRVSLKVVTRE